MRGMTVRSIALVGFVTLTAVATALGNTTPLIGREGPSAGA